MELRSVVQNWLNTEPRLIGGRYCPLRRQTSAQAIVDKERRLPQSYKALYKLTYSVKPSRSLLRAGARSGNRSID
jgi:hypothetical protein